MMSGDEISERLIVGFESFISLGSAFLSTVTGANIPPLSTPAICHLYGSETPTTEFFLELYITEEDDVCVASDWIVLFLQFLMVHALSWWTRWLVLEPLARRYLGETRATSKRVRKFSQALVHTVFHVLSAWCAWRILSPKSWLWNNEEWSHREDPIVAPDLKFYYLFYAARCLSDTLSLKYEYARSDTWAYAVHHIVSFALVLGSAMTGYTRIGCIMMFFMDWADPFMLTAKMFRYLSVDRRDGYQFVANRLFELFGIVFLVSHNIMLNYVVWVCLRDFPESAIALKMLCVSLVLLQTFWLGGIVRTTVNHFSDKGFSDKGNVDDFLSDSETEEDGHAEERKGVARKRKVGKPKKQ